MARAGELLPPRLFQRNQMLRRDPNGSYINYT